MTKEQQGYRKTGLLGGSFNPLHIGHLRLCMEMIEQAHIDQIELIPAHIPPHKEISDILPFEMRFAMLESAIADHADICVNPLEKKRPGPSYTWDTLESVVNQRPESQFCFIMGDCDLLTVPKWYRGRDIPQLCDIFVVGRTGAGKDRLSDFITDFWDAKRAGNDSWVVNQGRRIRYFSLPRIDISSSMIRSRWLEGRSIDWLVPAEVKKYLDSCRYEVENIWSKRSCT